MRKTKIVATVGPATASREMVAAIIEAGADVVRLSGSHADVEELDARCRMVRDVAAASGAVVAVVLDLPGPKLRVGDVASGTTVLSGSEFHLVSGECIGDAEHACVTYAGLSEDVRPGDRILIDDGRIELRTESVEPGDVTAIVVVGGLLGSHKGVNIPGVHLSVDAITPRDESLLGWALDVGVDYVAQSFVRSADDVRRLRAHMGERIIPIIAKIEKHEAVEVVEEIVEVADAVMVARGDLGVELPPEQVPVIQRRIVQLARAAGRPVIVATQMLDSMTSSPRPTRAEASDVANAIFGRVDAVMLSAETAVGSYPVEAVCTMARIATTAEEALPVMPVDQRAVPRGPGDIQQAVSHAAVGLAADIGLVAIVTPTQSGATPRSVACYRPDAAIIAPTPSAAVARRLGLVWGVTPLVSELSDDTDTMLDQACQAALDSGLVGSGERVAITAGRAVSTPGGTDFILVRSA